MAQTTVDGSFIDDDAVTAAKLAADAVVNASIASGAAIDATKIADGTVTSVEFQYINTLGSNAQTQLDAKLDMSWQPIVTASTLNALVGKAYPINTTSNACTVTLPASPSLGDTITFLDYARTFGTNALTLSLNSLKFQSDTASVLYSTSGQSLTIVYMDTTQGWIPSNDKVINTRIRLAWLVVAGGGGGGWNAAGGGGAGGFRTGAGLVVSTGTQYSVTVGAGGAGSGSSGVMGSNGGNSVFSGSGLTTADYTSTGGGAGGDGNGGANGAAGGSGGGRQSGGDAAAGGAGNTPSTSPSQGNDGGGSAAIGGGYPGGGGGGASAVGVTPASSSASGGAGGAGENNVMGLSDADSYTFMTAISAGVVSSGARYFAGGGGGGANSGGGGAGGIGGGGAGGSGGIGTAGTANTGGGGGAGQASGIAGGSGIVILRVLTSLYSGTTTGNPTVATSGSYTLIKFTGDGTYTA
jgi:hypothetical protein